MRVVEQQLAAIVEPELQKKLGAFRHKLGVKKAGFPGIADWNGTAIGQWDIFPDIPVSSVPVYRGNELYAYSHHPAICKFKDHYIVSWSNGFRHEDHFGQQIHYSLSRDGEQWEPYRVLAPTAYDERDTTGVVRNNAGMAVCGNKLYAYAGVCASDSNTGMGPDPRQTKQMWLDVYGTEDLVHWEHHERIADDIYLFEAPRLTRQGDFMCCGFDIHDWEQGLVLLWERGRKPNEKPLRIKLPKSAAGIVPEQGTWYQDDKGILWMYLRDGSVSLRLALSRSEDGGRTWTEPLRTDFPNTYSRAYAGRLSDGRFYIAGNNYDHYLDRSHLLIGLSDGGDLFDRMRILRSEPTTRRMDGYHKENGYHYPNCIADNGRLLIACSENKEDILVVIVDEKYL